MNNNIASFIDEDLNISTEQNEIHDVQITPAKSPQYQSPKPLDYDRDTRYRQMTQRAGAGGSDVKSVYISLVPESPNYNTNPSPRKGSQATDRSSLMNGKAEIAMQIDKPGDVSANQTFSSDDKSSLFMPAGNYEIYQRLDKIECDILDLKSSSTTLEKMHNYFNQESGLEKLQQKLQFSQ